MQRKFDETDLAILEKLVRDIRMGNKEIGKGLGIQRQVVDYRIKKMESNGTILGYRMMANLSRLGFEYRRLHIKLNSCAMKEKEEVLGYLSALKTAVWVVDCDGRYDVLVGIASRDAYEFKGILDAFIVEFHGLIDYYDFVHVLEVATPVRDLRGSMQTREVQGYVAGKFPQDALSVLDKKVVNELARDGRQTAIALARRIHEEPATVNYHIKRVLGKGLVYSNLVFGYDVFGYELYKTLIYLKNPTKKRIEELKRFSRAVPRIWNYIETMGRWQFEFDIESRGHNDYYEIMDIMEERFSDIVASYDTIYIRKEWKFSFDVFDV